MPTTYTLVVVNISTAPRHKTIKAMAFYKKMKMKVNGKWYPKSVLVGSAVTTEQVAKRLAAESTVSPADVRAVLTALGGVMGDYMAQGRSVKLDGIGSFYFTAQAKKNGVATEKEVTAALINDVRGLTDVDIEWEEWKGKVEAAESGTSSGGGENPLP